MTTNLLFFLTEVVMMQGVGCLVLDKPSVHLISCLSFQFQGLIPVV